MNTFLSNVMTLKELSQFYKNLAEMHSAGINFLSFFESLNSIEKNAPRQLQFRYIIDSLRKGKPLCEALQKTRLVPVFDLPVLQSAEKSGQLLLAFENLSKKYQSGAQAEKTIWTGLMSPFFTLTAALFILPFADFFTGKIAWTGYFLRSFVPLGITIAVVCFFYQINRKAYYDLSLAQKRHNVLLKIPYLSSLSQKIALEKFTISLSFMLDAGLTAFEALEYAGQNSADKNLYKSAKNILQMLKSGNTLAQAFDRNNSFSADVINSIKLGAESGKLPAFLLRTSEKINSEINERIQKLSKLIPLIIYWLVSFYIAWQIIVFYTGHLNQLNKLF